MSVTHVKHKKELALARRVCREWQALDPDEVVAWRFRQKGLAEAYEWSGGWSHGRELLAMEDAPSYVVYGIARALHKSGWDINEAKNWDRSLDGNKYGPSDLWKAVVDELLPEAKVVRKERVQRSHGGVGSLLP